MIKLWDDLKFLRIQRIIDLNIWLMSVQQVLIIYKSF